MTHKKAKEKRVIFYFMVFIGVLNLILGAILMLKGRSFDDYYLPLIMGVLLLGTSPMYLRKSSASERSESNKA